VTGLLLTALLGVSSQPGIVDRIEGSWAVVEWPDGSFGDVPVALFERPPLESQAVRMWLLQHPRGPWRPVDGQLRLGSGAPPMDFTIPAPRGAHPDRRYLVVLTVPPPEPGVAADVQRDRVASGGHPPMNPR
jgi:hypothetical protein